MLVSIGIGVLGLASPPGAEDADAPRGARLVWEAPPSCPSREDVIGEIETILGPSASGDPVDLEATAKVRAVDGHHRLTIRVQTPSGTRTRELEAAHCDDLAAYTAVLVAIAIDPGAMPSPETPPPSNEPPAEVAPPEAPPAMVPPAAAPAEQQHAEQPSASRRGPAGSVLVYVGPSLGTLPSATAVVGLGGALRWRALRIDLGVGHRIVQETARVLPSPATAVLWSTFAHTDVCGVPQVPRVEFPLCGGVEAGALSGRARAVSEPRSGRAPWLAFRVGAGLLASPWRRVALGVRATLQIPVVRARFHVEGAGELHQVGAVGGDITAVVEVRFP